MTDILDRIDAAVAEQCACGCGQALDPNGPSGWFATHACQWRWANQNVTDPADVYRQPDASGDNIDLPLRPTVRQAAEDELVHPRTGAIRRDWQPAPLYRYCRQCQTAAEPVSGWVALNNAAAGETVDMVERSFCPACRQPYPGPRLTLLRQDDFHRDHIVVRLHDATRYVEARIEAEILYLHQAPEAFWAQVLRQLEARLSEHWADVPGEPDVIADVEGITEWRDGPVGPNRVYEMWLQQQEFTARHFPPDPQDLLRRISLT